MDKNAAGIINYSFAADAFRSLQLLIKREANDRGAPDRDLVVRVSFGSEKRACNYHNSSAAALLFKWVERAGGSQ